MGVGTLRLGYKISIKYTKYASIEIETEYF